jgi:nicotinate-nucleotide pyrophosphorylase (carboxylating)
MQLHTVKTLIQTALNEDIGSGDITTDNLIDPNLTGSSVLMAKEPLVLAGIDIARQVFHTLDATIEFKALLADGETADIGEPLAQIQGNLAALLIGERTALNFLQRLSGIATNVAAYVGLLEGTSVRLVDTRKTTPGWRVLEKYAVRVGGAHNHRMGLYDGVLIKDNHIAAFGGVTESILHIRKHVSHLVKIEVEASTLAEVKEALQAGVDVIMLDNMSLENVKTAVAIIQKAALVEVSGNVTQAELADLADTGVDIISIGALTHGARSVDISMRIN